jgi:CoA:oxalate CoA-transferase
MRPLLMPIPMECQDGHIMISALTEREWQDLMHLMGNPQWASDERFSHWIQRHLHGDEINPHVQEWARQFKKDELFHKLQANALAAAPVNTPEDLVKSLQMEARGFFVELEHPEVGKLKHPTAAYKFSITPWTGERAAPLLGQHNEDIYCGRLGYDKEAVVRMREDRVI